MCKGMEGSIWHRANVGEECAEEPYALWAYRMNFKWLAESKRRQQQRSPSIELPDHYHRTPESVAARMITLTHRSHFKLYSHFSSLLHYSNQFHSFFFNQRFARQSVWLLLKIDLTGHFSGVVSLHRAWWGSKPACAYGLVAYAHHWGTASIPWPCYAFGLKGFHLWKGLIFQISLSVFASNSGFASIL